MTRSAHALVPVVVLVLVLSVLALASCTSVPEGPRAAYVVGGERKTVHIVAVGLASIVVVREHGMSDEIVDLAWTHDGRVVALLKTGAVFVVDEKGAVLPAATPPANEWGAGATNARYVAHQSEQARVAAALAAGEELLGDFDVRYGSDPYPSEQTKLVRVGDVVRLAHCRYHQLDGAVKHCEDWAWSSLSLAPAVVFGPVTTLAASPADPDDQAAEAERTRSRPPTKETPLHAPAATAMGR